MNDIHSHHHVASRENAKNSKRKTRLSIALFLNLIIVVSQIIFGLVAGSLALLADAGHNLSDVGAIALSLYAVILLSRKPTEEKSFGYHRVGILAAQANAVLIILVTIFIAYESVERILNPAPIKSMIVIVVAGIAAVINLGSAVSIRESHADHNHDLNMSSAMLHLVADGVASIAVMATGIIIFVVDKWYWLDPSISLLIGFMIAYQGFKLLRKANEVLLESTPKNIDIGLLKEKVKELENVQDIHDLHIWSLSNEFHALSAHVVLTDELMLKEAQLIGTKIKTILESDFLISHATLEYECSKKIK